MPDKEEQVPIQLPPLGEACGPFLRYHGINLEQGLWYGSVLYISNSTARNPELTLTGGPEPKNYAPTELASWRGYRFLRYDLNLRMGDTQSIRYGYKVGPAKPYDFWVAGVKETQWRWAFTSCNGFSGGVEQSTRDEMGGVPALWHDMMRQHAEKPFLAIAGGGDQIYCDPVWDLPLLKEWLLVKGRENRNTAPWTPALDEQIMNFYFDIYFRHFTTAGFCDAYACIPVLNILDDHDFWDGMGSYPQYLETSQVFMNLKRIAYKFYLLFQHHTTPELAVKEGYLGCRQGSYSMIKSLGPEVGIAMIDARGERTTHRICSAESWDEIFAAIDKLPPTTRQLVFVTGVPLVYPRMEIADNFLTGLASSKRVVNKGFNKVTYGIGRGVGAIFGRGAKNNFDKGVQNMKSGLGKSGMMGSLLNQFGEPELLDDLVDHWTHENHANERKTVVLRLQEFAKARKVRVTFLAGDVHCAAVGRFYNKKQPNDFRMMYQIISSAVGNVPPPDPVLGALHRNAKEHRLDMHTKEQMVDVFEHDVDGKKLGKKKLMGRRNWCKVEGIPDRGIRFTIQVEAKDFKGPSTPYSVDIPAVV